MCFALALPRLVIDTIHGTGLETAHARPIATIHLGACYPCYRKACVTLAFVHSNSTFLGLVSCTSLLLACVLYSEVSALILVVNSALLEYQFIFDLAPQILCEAKHEVVSLVQV